MTATLEEMAEQAGMMDDGGIWFSTDGESDVSPEALASFAALVRAQARAEALEDAARACDRRAGFWHHDDVRSDEDGNCAAAIRALPQP